jgi:arsenate reductase
MIFTKTDKAITLIYHSGNHLGRQVLAFAQAERLPVYDIDLAHTPIRGVHWAELLQRMKLKVVDLINLNHPDFTQKFTSDTDLNEHDWLTLLEKNPEILKGPIVMKGEKVVMMSNAQDMLHFV